jgi:transposase
MLQIDKIVVGVGITGDRVGRSGVTGRRISCRNRLRLDRRRATEGRIVEDRMEYFAGLDVSLETVNVCIVNAAGDILLEKKIAAEPAAIVHLLKSFGSPFKRIGLEAGPTSSWLYGELRAAGYGAICLECRHVKAGLSAMRNKTDRNDARGIAQLVRLGWFRQVHVKSEEAQRTRMLLVNRQQL